MPRGDSPFPPALVRFARYAVIGASTLLLDLALLYGAVTGLGIPYYVATPCTFLIAISCNYILSRHFVFRGTFRGWSVGYTYFALVALIGALVTTGLVALLVHFVGLYYLLARILVAGLVGVANYLFNLYVNFNAAGKPEPIPEP